MILKVILLDIIDNAKSLPYEIYDDSGCFDILRTLIGSSSHVIIHDDVSYLLTYHYNFSDVMGNANESYYLIERMPCIKLN